MLVVIDINVMRRQERNWVLVVVVDGLLLSSIDAVIVHHIADLTYTSIIHRRCRRCLVSLVVFEEAYVVIVDLLLFLMFRIDATFIDVVTLFSYCRVDIPFTFCRRTRRLHVVVIADLVSCMPSCRCCCYYRRFDVFIDVLI